MKSSFLVQETLAEASRVHDVAMDFIEQELGANYFPKNWENLKSKEDPTGKVERWIRDVGFEVGAKEVVSAIENLAKCPKPWITCFRQPNPHARPSRNQR